MRFKSKVPWVPSSGWWLMSLRLGLALLAYYVYGTPQRRAAPTVIFYAALLVAVGLGFISGLLENALIPLVLAVLIRWQVTGRLPLWLLVVGFVGFVVLNAVKGDYRSQAWFSGEELDPGERLTLWADLGQGVVVKRPAAIPCATPRT